LSCVEKARKVGWSGAGKGLVSVRLSAGRKWTRELGLPLGPDQRGIVVRSRLPALFGYHLIRDILTEKHLGRREWAAAKFRFRTCQLLLGRSCTARRVGWSSKRPREPEAHRERVSVANSGRNSDTNMRGKMNLIQIRNIYLYSIYFVKCKII